MLERMFDPERRRVADEVNASAERLRVLARQALQGVWRAERDGDQVVIVGRDGETVATLGGMWALTTADYIVTVHPLVALTLAELLSRAHNEIRQGHMSSPIQGLVHTLARMLAEDRSATRSS